MNTKKKIIFLASAFFVLLTGILFFPNESYAQTATSSITITSPNGGEELIVGSTYMIRWDSTGSFNNVAISFFRVGGGSVLKTSESGVFDIGTVSNTGSYSWTVRTGLVPASDYKLRIIKLDDADFGVRDESDAAFTIKEGMVITSPAPGAVWKMSSSQIIIWTSDVPDHEITIGLVATDGRSSYPIGFRKFSSSDQSFTWVVQSYVKEGDYFIRLMSGDRSIVEAITPYTIKVIPSDASILITAPQEGSAIEKGSLFTIQWDTTGDISLIQVELFYIPTSPDKNGAGYILSSPQKMPNTGELIWNVSPTLPTDGDYLIRISDALNVYLGDSIELNVEKSSTGTLFSLPSRAAMASLLAVAQTQTYTGWFSGRFTLVEPSVKVPEIVAPTPTAPTTPSALGENSLIILPGDDRVFVIKNNKKEHIANVDVFNQRGYKWENVQKVDRSTFDSYASKTLLLRAVGDARVYEIINGKKRHIRSAKAFSDSGFDWTDVQEVTKSEVEVYPRLFLVRAERDERVYYITEGGLKKWIQNIDIFNSYNNKWEDVTIVSPTVLAQHDDVSLIKLSGTKKVYKLEGSVKRHIKTVNAFNALGLDWNKIAPVNEAEFNFYEEGDAIE